MPSNRAYVLQSRPAALPGRDNFRLVESETREPGEGEVLVRNRFLSVDPYMRGRMSEARSYAAPQPLGEVMIGGTAGEVVASRSPRLAPGDLVVGHGGWQHFTTSSAGAWRKVAPSRLPLSAHLGVVGMPGVTAWYAMDRILLPKAGETVLVSAATGAVGSVAGQLARLRGARAVAIAGGAEKCAHALADLGYAAAVDHRSAGFADELSRALPDGLDCLFENVGGKPFEAAMRRLNSHSRVAICGLIASYNGAPTVLPDMRVVLVMQVSIKGFIVPDDREVWHAALAELTPLAEAGKLVFRETISDGLETAPDAFAGLFAGRNLGKQIVRLE